MSVTKHEFGTTKDGKDVSCFTIRNTSGASVSVLNYGATIQSLKTFDRNSNLLDVCLGYDNIAAYEAGTSFIGATIGRYANRIKDGQITINGHEFALTRNENNNQLHGGRGFDKRMFSYEIISDNTVMFSYSSLDGEEGFPGKLDVKVFFSLSEDNTLTISYEAISDKDTYVNLTNHSYFNLNGAGNGDILSHSLKLYSSYITPIDAQCIPTGKIVHVEGTPFDFKQSKIIGSDIEKNDPQLKCGNGYDHNFVLDGKPGMKKAAVLRSDTSGIQMTVSTTMPGIQFYSGNAMETEQGKGGIYSKHSGLCLETQYYPDTPHNPDFPSALLYAGEAYKHYTIYAFSIVND